MIGYESPTVSFELFPELPTELRLQIWRLSLPARLVEVKYDSEEDTCFPLTPLPVLFFTARESRYEALRLYRKLFGTKTHPERTIYFSPILDTLYIPRPSNILGYEDSARDFATLVTGIEEVQNLAVDYVDASTRRPWETYNKSVLIRGFPLVMEVQMIINDRDAQDKDQSNAQERRPASNTLFSLTEPRADKANITRLLIDTEMSFRYEAGVDIDVAAAGDEKPQEGMVGELMDEEVEIHEVATKVWSGVPKLVLMSKVLAE